MFDCGENFGSDRLCHQACRATCQTDCMSGGCAGACAPQRFSESCEDGAETHCRSQCKELIDETCPQMCFVVIAPDAFRIDQRCLANCRACLGSGARQFDFPFSPGCTGSSCNEGVGCVSDCKSVALTGRSRTRCQENVPRTSCATLQSSRCSTACN